MFHCRYSEDWWINWILTKQSIVLQFVSVLQVCSTFVCPARVCVEGYTWVKFLPVMCYGFQTCLLMYTSLAHFYGCLDYLFHSLMFTFKGRHTCAPWCECDCGECAQRNVIRNIEIVIILLLCNEMCFITCNAGISTTDCIQVTSQAVCSLTSVCTSAQSSNLWSWTFSEIWH
jgi:hypothetical protein